MSGKLNKVVMFIRLYISVSTQNHRHVGQNVCFQYYACAVEKIVLKRSKTSINTEYQQCLSMLSQEINKQHSDKSNAIYFNCGSEYTCSIKWLQAVMSVLQ